MTAYFVNTFIEVPTGDAYDLPGTGDTLLVTSAGSLVTLLGGDGIDSTGNSEQITLDGLAYSAGNFGVSLSGAGTNLWPWLRVVASYNLPEGRTHPNVGPGGPFRPQQPRALTEALMTRGVALWNRFGHCPSPGLGVVAPKRARANGRRRLVAWSSRLPSRRPRQRARTEPIGTPPQT